MQRFDKYDKGIVKDQNILSCNKYIVNTTWT